MIKHKELLLKVQANLASKSKELTRATKEYMEQLETSKDYSVLMDYTNSVLSNKLEEIREQIIPLVNSAYESIFQDDKLKFELTTKVKRNRTTYSVNIVDETNVASGLKVSGLMDSFGGGVVVLTSVMLRMIFIMLTGRPKFIILDETLNPISEKYREKTSQLLSKLCEQLGFVLVIITFDENGLFSSHAHTMYEAKRVSKSTTAFEKVK